MHITEGPLSLRVREQRKDTIDTQYLKPKVMQQWIDNLPMGSIGETGRQCYQMMVKLNQTIVNPDDRYKLLSALRYPIHFVYENVNRLVLRSPSTLTLTEKKALTLSQMLHSEFAIGYNSALIDYVEKNKTKKVKQLSVKCAARALDCFTKVQICSLQMYAQYPKSLWYEMNQLYYFLEKTGIADKNLRSNKSLPMTAAIQYKRALLLSMANPYQLSPKDIEKIFAASDRWAPLGEIKPFKEKAEGFLIDLGSDIPPFHRELEFRPPDRLWRIFDMSKALDEIQKKLSSSSASENIKDERRIYHHLLNAWGSMSKRAFPRHELSSPVSYTLGLESTHYLMTGLFNPVSDSKIPNPFDEGASLTQAGVLEDAWRRGAVSFHNLQKEAEDPWKNWCVSENINSVARERGYLLSRGKLLDASPGGYRLGLSSMDNHKLQVGDLIGLQINQSSEKPHWQVVAIRWIRQGGQVTQVGVKVLAPAMTCVLSGYHDEDKNTETEVYRGFMLPALKGIGQQPSLILPPHYHSDEIVTIWHNNKKYEIRLNNLLSSTNNYRQFDYVRMTEPTHFRIRRENEIHDPHKRDDDSAYFSVDWGY